MYNRYIPQPDGSFRCSRIQESKPPVPPKRHDPPREEPRKEDCQMPEKPPHRDTKQEKQQPRKDCPKAQANQTAGSFLRQLLPKDLDTGDLIVILLLLLMAGDCREDQNTALLTLALYLFM